MLLSVHCHNGERERWREVEREMEGERCGEREREVTSQQAVDGSLVSLLCWSADFEDTLGNTADSTRRHRRRQPTTTKDSMATADGSLAASIPGSEGEDVRSEEDGVAGGGKGGIRVGGRTEGQSV